MKATVLCYALNFKQFFIQFCGFALGSGQAEMSFVVQ